MYGMTVSRFSFVLAVVIPASALVISAATRPAGGEAWSTSYSIANATIGITAVWSFFGCLVAGLITAKPRSPWAISARRIAMDAGSYVLAVLAFFAVLTLVGTAHRLVGAAMISCLPASFALFYAVHREHPLDWMRLPLRRYVSRFLSAAVVSWIAIGLPILAMFALIMLAGALGLDGLAIALTFLHYILYYGFFALLAVVALVGISAKLVERRLDREAGLTVAFYQPTGHYRVIPEDEAEDLRRRLAFSDGVEIRKAWGLEGAPYKRLDAVLPTGERLTVLETRRELLTQRIPVWAAGLFIHAVSNEPGGPRRRRLRFFQCIDCRWESVPAMLAGNEVGRLGFAQHQDLIGSWRCRDCRATRTDFEGTDNQVLIAYRNSEPPELAYILGLFVLYSRSYYPRSVAVPSTTVAPAA